MDTKIFCDKVTVNPHTGHMTVRLRSETTHENAKWSGPVKDWGVDSHTFHERFGGDQQQLVNYLVSEHRAFIGRHQGLTEELTKLEGQQIG